MRSVREHPDGNRWICEARFDRRCGSPAHAMLLLIWVVSAGGP
jgi:hypothetical protein